MLLGAKAPKMVNADSNAMTKAKGAAMTLLHRSSIFIPSFYTLPFLNRQSVLAADHAFCSLAKHFG